MRIMITCCCFLFISGASAQQHDKAEPTVIPVAEEFLPVSNPEWYTDVIITNRAPLARPTGAGRANGVAFVAIPDTGLIPGRGLVTYRTTNFGATWSIASSISPALIVQKTKTIRAANDSLYVFFLTNGRVYMWNLEGTTLRQPHSSINTWRDFDVVASNNGRLYLFLDNGEDNEIWGITSSNFGATWEQAYMGVYRPAAHPRACINTVFGRRDTVFLSYFWPLQPDIFRSPIYMKRMRENNGLLQELDVLTINNDTTYERYDFQIARARNVVWFFTMREPAFGGYRHIRCRVSTNIGETWGSAFTVAPHSSADQYWFDSSPYSDGIDFIYVVDSASTSNDRLMYGSIAATSPTTLSSPRRISNYPPVPSSRDYNPSLVSYYPEDPGAVWVGLDGTLRRVVYDHSNFSPLDVEPPTVNVPEAFSLHQNYPNPFNPTTTIRFSIPTSGYVTLKVYDMLGRDVQTLVSENLHAGKYFTQFDAGNLASGIYVYRLQAGSYSASKKLVVLR